MKSENFSTFNRRAVHTALASALVLGMAGHGSDAQAASATNTATATVVTPIAIAAGDTLRFGSFSTSAASQTVTINATTGTRTSSGALLATSTVGRATFNVTGSGVLTYAITLPTNGTVNITTGTATAPETMAVSNFTSDPSGTGALTAGAQTLGVGATITTVGSQVAGAYTGTFNVSVEYN
jgi:hypothetical protein